MVTSTAKGVPVTLLDAVTSGIGTAVVVPITSKNQRVHTRGAGTITGGTILIEEAKDPAYTGTWSEIQSITASDLTGGAETVTHIVGTMNAIRGRISSAILGGGSITMELVTD